MAMRNLDNMRQEIIYSYVFTDFWRPNTHIYLQCVVLGSLYRILLFFPLQLCRNYCTDSFSSLSKAKKTRSMSAKRSYFRRCSLVMWFIIGGLRKTQSELLQPYSRIFTGFVLSPTLQKFVLTLSQNLSVYSKTYEGNMHRVSANDTFINTRNVRKHSHCVVSHTTGP